MAVDDVFLEASKIQWGGSSVYGAVSSRIHTWRPRTGITKELRCLIRMTCALAVAVDQVGGKNTGAQDCEAHEKCDASVHAYIDAFVHVDTFLSIYHKDGSAEEHNS